MHSVGNETSPAHADYMPRLIDPMVDRYLRLFRAISIEGTMWSGKTWTAEQHAKSEISIDNEFTADIIKGDLSMALMGPQPRVIDEWQEIPPIWDAVRHAVDTSSDTGQYILTGSSTPASEEVHHSGAGRIARLRLWPMTLYERRRSNPSYSLTDLFANTVQTTAVETDFRLLADAICHGGFPGTVDYSTQDAAILMDQYVNAIADSARKESPRGPYEVKRLMQSLARNVGSQVTQKTLAKDLFVDEPDASPNTQGRYVRQWTGYLLSRFVIDELRGWDAPIKSPRRLRTKPKYTFADTALPAALLNLTPSRLLDNSQIFGQLFEELCIRDLRVFASVMDPTLMPRLFYYRDSNGLEVDVIIELATGEWGAIEIKLGYTSVKAAESNLLRLAKKVAANPAARNPDPSFLAVMVGKTDYQYRTSNGVFVVPLTGLGPD